MREMQLILIGIWILHPKDDKEGLVECIGLGELVDDFISILALLSEPHECKNPRQLANADPEVLFANLNNKCGKKNIPPPQALFSQRVG